MKASNLARAVLAARAVLGCSHDTPSNAPLSGAQGTGPRQDLNARPRRAALPAPTAFVAGRLRKLAPFGDELRARIDPLHSGWPSEVLA